MSFALSPSCWKSGPLRTTLLSPRSGVNLSLVNQVLPRHSSALAFSRRRNHNSSLSSSSKKKMCKEVKDEEEDEIEEDAFEALFSMLEEDLKNDVDLDEDDDIKEEDVEQLQRELEEVLGIAGDDDDDVILAEDDDNEGEEEDDDEEEEEEEEEERPVKLKNWQFRRLAAALKAGRRKISIKNLAAELWLDRALILELLRDPPSNLVMMSATLPDDPAPVALRVVETDEIVESTHKEMVAVDTKVSESEKKAPVHVMRNQWYAQKRLKKVQVDTLERVYRRTKRPTNTMISSIVQVTNLPRKRVVKWFEEKRAEEGVPDHRVPYQRSVVETASS